MNNPADNMLSPQPSLFVEDEEIVGRTVAKVYLDDYHAYFLFTDGTFTRISHGGGYYLTDNEMMFDPPENEKQVLDDLKNDKLQDRI